MSVSHREAFGWTRAMLHLISRPQQPCKHCHYPPLQARKSRILAIISKLSWPKISLHFFFPLNSASLSPSRLTHSVA